MWIEYAQLVFPQVEELSRELPVVLPLGKPLPARPGGLTEGILLPPLPYGFADPLLLDLRDILGSLAQMLREDGFQQLYLWGPLEVDGWQTLQAEIGPLQLPQGPIKVVPIGHTEQHGFHLPLATDTLIVEGLCKGRTDALPAWPYGVSTHRRQFPGTLSLDPRAFEDFFVELSGRLGRSGQTRVVFFLNGHGGNHSFLVNACKFAGERYRDWLTATTFLHTASGAALEQMLHERSSQLMGHACELETSYLLALHPEQVHMDRAVDELDFCQSPEVRMDWLESGALILNPPWSDDSKTGSYGAPRQASAEKGARWLKAARAELQRLLEECQQQWCQREARRSQGWTEGAWRASWQELSARGSVQPPTGGGR